MCYDAEPCCYYNDSTNKCVESDWTNSENTAEKLPCLTTPYNSY